MKNLVITSIIVISTFLSIIAQPTKSEKANYHLTQTAKKAKLVGTTSGYSINGQILWTGSNGFMDKENEIPFTENTITRLASIAKSMTSVAIFQLIEKGLIHLDDPVQKFLPTFPMKSKKSITVRHLLAHTSGMAGYGSAKEAESTIEYTNLQNAVELFMDRDLQFEPGADFGYTTYGYTVLGRILEVASGMTYEQYLQENIWDWCDMKNTGVEHFDESYANKSLLYHKKKRKAKLAKKNNLSNRIPGGGFYSTLHDLFKFAHAVIDNKLVTEQSFKSMTEISSTYKDGNPYGFGWFLYGPKSQQNLVIGHSGGQTGASTQMLINLRNKSVSIALSNTSGAWEDVFGLSANVINTFNDPNIEEDTEKAGR